MTRRQILRFFELEQKTEAARRRTWISDANAAHHGGTKTEDLLRRLERLSG